jgi:serine/threonine-protein kinase
MPGDVLAGKYRVDRVLGIGGMGVVVAATHLELHQTVALKFVLPSAMQNEGAVERFLREARAAVKLKSEHVAKVLDVGRLETGSPYMVMEFLEGMDLGAVIEQNGPLPVPVACDYVIQACEALAEAHSIGIVHRDVKPQNLFLTRAVGGSALVKVLDFGISKFQQGTSGNQALTRTTSVMGSPLYMSPEQMRSSKLVDPRSDIWALGVILYELLTARVPFEAETMPELCLKVVGEPPQPIQHSRPDLPAHLVAVIDRCLQKDPNGRFANTGELASALEPFAPAGSHRAAERARMVLSGSSTGPMPSQALVSRPSMPSAATAAAWGGAKTELDRTGGNAKKGFPVLPVALAGLVVVGGAIAVVAVVASKSKTPPAPTATAAANSAPPPPATTAAATTTPSATAASTATAAGTATTSATASASATTSTKPTAKPTATIAVPTAKPTSKPPDDDIPGMRR